MNEKQKIYALKAIQPWDVKGNADYWIPLLFEEMNKGRARFGWSWDNEQNLKSLRMKLDNDGWDSFSDDQKDNWKHSHRLLEVQPGDFLIYINMPVWGECVLVQCSGVVDDLYKYTDIWDPEMRSDFRHSLQCNFLDRFNRKDPIVHPKLRRRLGLQGSFYRIWTEEEFFEFHRDLKEGNAGKSAKTRFQDKIVPYLEKISKELSNHFPSKDLEKFFLDVLQNLPNALEVRKGPDVNGADLEIVYEGGLGGDLGFESEEKLCAVQVKSYTGEMDYIKAIDDIRKAFNDSSRNYDRGLILSSAEEISEKFESELNGLRRDFKEKPVGILYGAEIAKLIMRNIEKI